jgi:hypothetical protein
MRTCTAPHLGALQLQPLLQLALRLQERARLLFLGAAFAQLAARQLAPPRALKCHRRELGTQD